jgi:predicted sulfurtransferase
LDWLGLVAIVQVLDQRLASVDRSTPIMMYCTGGIRCVKARGIAQ